MTLLFSISCDSYSQIRTIDLSLFCVKQWEEEKFFILFRYCIVKIEVPISLTYVYETRGSCLCLARYFFKTKTSCKYRIRRLFCSDRGMAENI
jgi:hypothetical protein